MSGEVQGLALLTATFAFAPVLHTALVVNLQSPVKTKACNEAVPPYVFSDRK